MQAVPAGASGGMDGGCGGVQAVLAATNTRACRASSTLAPTTGAVLELGCQELVPDPYPTLTLILSPPFFYSSPVLTSTLTVSPALVLSLLTLTPTLAPTTGAVLKLDDQELVGQLGAKHADPLWAIAWKFPPQETTTRVLQISLTLGKQGKVGGSTMCVRVCVYVCVCVCVEIERAERRVHRAPF